MEERSYLNPPGLPDWSAFFSQVVVVRGAPISSVFVSGQVGVDAQKRLAGDGSLVAQAEQVFDNLARALESAGATLADITKLTIYVVAYQPDHAELIAPVLGKRFAPAACPRARSSACRRWPAANS